MTTLALRFMWALFLSSCLLAPDRPERSLSAPSVIAIEADPPEAAPGERVLLRAIVASPDGPIEDATARWSLCRTPRALSENTAVSAACAEREEVPLSARGDSIQISVPADACARFGPETKAGLRPTDPDITGGYYQPLRLAVQGAEIALHRQRIRCALANAPLSVAQAFAQRYQPNRAPQNDGITWQGDPASVNAGAILTLRLALADDARERYLVYDSARGQLGEREEQLSVRWSVSHGALLERESEPDGALAKVRWQTPETPGPAFVWAVVRDERGGVTSAVRELEIVAHEGD